MFNLTSGIIQSSRNTGQRITPRLVQIDLHHLIKLIINKEIEDEIRLIHLKKVKQISIFIKYLQLFTDSKTLIGFM